MSPPSLAPDWARIDAMTLDADDLEAWLAYHDHRYTVLAAPEVPDQVFDAAVARLRTLRPDAQLLTTLGLIASDAAGRIAHRVPMLSLDKCYDDATFQSWVGDADPALVASPKIDGAAVSIRYHADGRFHVAVTRGDGQRGESVGHNVARIPGVPAALPPAAVARATEAIEVRGEVYMKLSAFEEVASLFANPRNVAAGALKAKDSDGVAPESLSFLAYDVLGIAVAREADKGAALRALGFEPAPSVACTRADAAAVFADWQQRRDKLDFETDGVVFKLDDLAEQRRLGVTAHHPRWAVAWKFQGDSGKTKLIDVEWSVSRTGTITPVALVAPLTLSGVSIARATLHNLSNVERLALRRGDVLQLTRRGGVIPHVEGSEGGGSEVLGVPARCPSCDAPTEVRSSERKVAGETLTTRTLHCTQPSDCPAVLRQQLYHYTAALEIDGFGPKVLDALLDSGLVRDAADLYRLSPQQLTTLPRMGEVLAAKLVDQLQARRRVDLPRLLVALGIDGLGKHAAQLLASRWTLAELRQRTLADIAALPSMAQISAERIVAGLRDQAGLLDRLLEHVELVQASSSAASGPLSGEVVVFTGKLERMGRRDAQQAVARLGGLAGSSVTAETTLLVVAADELDAATPSAKLAKARKLAAEGRLTILSEPAFWARVAGGDGMTKVDDD